MRKWKTPRQWWYSSTWGTRRSSGRSCPPGPCQRRTSPLFRRWRKFHRKICPTELSVLEIIHLELQEEFNNICHTDRFRQKYKNVFQWRLIWVLVLGINWPPSYKVESYNKNKNFLLLNQNFIKKFDIGTKQLIKLIQIISAVLI